MINSSINSVLNLIFRLQTKERTLHIKLITVLRVHKRENIFRCWYPSVFYTECAMHTNRFYAKYLRVASTSRLFHIYHDFSSKSGAIHFVRISSQFLIIRAFNFIHGSTRYRSCIRVRNTRLARDYSCVTWWIANRYVYRCNVAKGERVSRITEKTT